MAAPLPPSAGSLRRLPAAVEAWWVQRAREAAGGVDAERALAALAPEVQRLSDRFTVARPARFEPYAGTPAERAAYGLFYFPPGWVRTGLPLAEARAVRRWQPPGGRALRLLDVGAGQGAAGLAAATLLSTWDPTVPIDLVALDHAPQALRDLERLARDVLPPPRGPRVTTVVTDVHRPAAWPAAAAGPFDLVLVSLVLNEVVPAGERHAARAWLEALAARLGPEGLLLVVEAGTQTEAARLTEVAADLVEHAGLHPWGPQLHPGAWRPAPDRRTWMHEVRRWSPPASLERVNRTLWRSVRELTFSYALLGRSAPAPLDPSPRIHRICSPVLRRRGRLTWLGLGADGRLAEFEVQDRDLERAERDRFLDLERGDVLVFPSLHPLGRPDAWRVPGPPEARRGPGMVDAPGALR